jgi:macrolide transport system ATP-binding/permease protein
MTNLPPSLSGNGLSACVILVLLVAAGLFAQNLNKAENVDMKLNATNRYITHINPQAAGYKNTEVEPLYQTVVDRFHAIPGVLKVGLATYTPTLLGATPLEHSDSGHC